MAKPLAIPLRWFRLQHSRDAMRTNPRQDSLLTYAQLLGSSVIWKALVTAAAMPITGFSLSRAEVLNSLNRDSGVDLRPRRVKPDQVPKVDAVCVDKVISGQYNLRNALTDGGLTPAEDGSSEPCPPMGAGPCPEGCRAINMWGMSEKITEEELLSEGRKFGAVRDVELLKPKNDGDLCCASITFEERSSAEEAQSVLHRTYFHGKEIRVGWGRAEDIWKTSGCTWLYVWIKKGTTAQQLYKGFRNAGAPCTDARVVREASADEPHGVGAVAFRNRAELRAIRAGLSGSHKTEW